MMISEREGERRVRLRERRGRGRERERERGGREGVEKRGRGIRWKT